MLRRKAFVCGVFFTFLLLHSPAAPNKSDQYAGQRDEDVRKRVKKWEITVRKVFHNVLKLYASHELTDLTDSLS